MVNCYGGIQVFLTFVGLRDACFTLTVFPATLNSRSEETDVATTVAYYHFSVPYIVLANILTSRFHYTLGRGKIVPRNII